MGRLLFVICLMGMLHGCASASPVTPEWERNLTPEQRVRLEEARINAAGMAVMGFGAGGGFRMPATTTPPAPSQRQCTYTSFGNTVSQNCY